MITYEKAHVRVAEFFFDEQESRTPADIVRYQFRPDPVKGCDSSDFHTLCLDLACDADTILSKMHKETRYEIRRAGKDNFACEYHSHPEAALAEEFFGFYDRFADIKNVPRVNRTRISAFQRHDVLDLSRVRGADGRVLVWHAYLRMRNCARLIHSASHFRLADKFEATMIGRANRHLHWMDMLHCKETGLGVYDFGGWYAGQTDVEKLKINHFKESFGGERVHQYNADRSNTLMGAAALGARVAMRLLDRRKWNW
ncbi:MAG: hypothetical protein ABSB88_06405 [Bryobacteraceae bacterium]|jgi:hypothetical protein